VFGLKHCSTRATLLIVVGGFVGGGCAAKQQTGYTSPDAAVQSLVAAERTHSVDELKSVLGSDSDDLILSGDSVQDRENADRFLSLYDEKHQLTPNPDHSVTLLIGKTDWPFPIPLVKEAKSDHWVFDTARGKDEIINRRIGRNEISTIGVCMAIIDAERDFVKRNSHTTAVPEYAAKFLSDPGKHNGLYWDTKPGEDESPLGPLVAAATSEGYPIGQRHPYHGYYYRILTSQGANGTLGAYDYIVNGKLVGGVGVIAWPADYGNSGVMTFITNHEGTVYQKDLGPDTEKAAHAINVFDPDPTWKHAN